jgi:hypothetical protein
MMFCLGMSVSTKVGWYDQQENVGVQVQAWEVGWYDQQENVGVQVQAWAAILQRCLVRLQSRRWKFGERMEPWRRRTALDERLCRMPRGRRSSKQKPQSGGVWVCGLA